MLKSRMMLVGHQIHIQGVQKYDGLYVLMKILQDNIDNIEKKYLLKKWYEIQMGQLIESKIKLA